MRGLSEPHAGMGRECGRNTNGVWMWGRRDRPGTGGSAPLRSLASLPCNRKPVGRVEKSGCTALGHLAHPPADVPNSFADAVGSNG